MLKRLLGNRELMIQASVLGVLVLVLSTLLIFRFTTRTSLEEERAKAHTILQTIFEIEQAHHDEFGTYLAIDRETNGDILRLNDLSGQFSYRVDISPGAFVAYAESEMDGAKEVWRVDQETPEPVLQ